MPKNPSEQEPLLTIAEAAAMLRKTTQTLLRWVHNGDIQAVKVQSGKSHRYLIARSVVLGKMELVGGPPPAWAPADPSTDEILRRHGLL